LLPQVKATSSSLKVNSGSAFEKLGMIASGCCFGSTMTFALRVFDHRAQVSAWQGLQDTDPAYPAFGDGCCATTVKLAADIIIRKTRHRIMLKSLAV